MMSTPLRFSPTGAAKVKTVAFGDGPLGMGLTDASSFRIDAGAGSHMQYSTTVQRFNQVADGSAGVAERSGLVEIGDLLVSVNGEDTAGRSKDEVLALVSSSGRPVELGFRRPLEREAISPIPSILAASPASTSASTLEPRRRAQVYAKLVQDFSNMQDALTASNERNAQLERDLIASKSAAELGRRQVLLLKSEHSSALAQIKGAYADNKSKHHTEAVEREAEISALRNQMSALRTELQGELDTQSRRAEAAMSDLAVMQGELAAALASHESVKQDLEQTKDLHRSHITAKTTELQNLANAHASERLQRESLERSFDQLKAAHAAQGATQQTDLQEASRTRAQLDAEKSKSGGLEQALVDLRSAHAELLSSKESELRELSRELAKEKTQREMIEQEMAHKNVVHASQVDSKVAEVNEIATARAEERAELHEVALAHVSEKTLREDLERALEQAKAAHETEVAAKNDELEQLASAHAAEKNALQGAQQKVLDMLQVKQMELDSANVKGEQMQAVAKIASHWRKHRSTVALKSVAAAHRNAATDRLRQSQAAADAARAALSKSLQDEMTIAVAHEKTQSEELQRQAEQAAAVQAEHIQMLSGEHAEASDLLMEKESSLSEMRFEARQKEGEKATVMELVAVQLQTLEDELRTTREDLEQERAAMEQERNQTATMVAAIQDGHKRVLSELLESKATQQAELAQLIEQATSGAGVEDDPDDLPMVLTTGPFGYSDDTVTTETSLSLGKPVGAAAASDGVGDKLKQQGLKIEPLDDQHGAVISYLGEMQSHIEKIQARFASGTGVQQALLTLKQRLERISSTADEAAATPSTANKVTSTPSKSPGRSLRLSTAQRAALQAAKDAEDESVREEQLHLARQKFQELDEDGSGNLDREEISNLAKWVLQSLLESTEGINMSIEQQLLEADKVIAHADTDGDGTLDFDEFANWFIPTCKNIQEHTRKQEKLRQQKRAQKLAARGGVRAKPSDSAVSPAGSIPGAPVSVVSTPQKTAPSTPSHAASSDVDLVPQILQEVAVALSAESAAEKELLSELSQLLGIVRDAMEQPTSTEHLQGEIARLQNELTAERKQFQAVDTKSREELELLTGRLEQLEQLEQTSKSVEDLEGRIQSLENELIGERQKVKGIKDLEGRIQSLENELTDERQKVRDADAEAQSQFKLLTARVEHAQAEAAQLESALASEKLLREQELSALRANSRPGTAEPAALQGTSSQIAAYLQGKGAGKYMEAVVAAFQAAGYEESEWLTTLQGMSQSDFQGFIMAVSTHYTLDGHQVDVAHVGAIAEKLSSVSIFAAVVKPGSDFLRELSLELQPRVAKAGSLVIKQGDVGTDMFFLTNGEVEVLRALDKPPITKLLPGASFGETALISDEPRNASIRAITDAELYVLSKTGLQKTLERFPHVADALEEDAWQKKSQLAFLEMEEPQPALPAAADVQGNQVRLMKGPAGFGIRINRDGLVQGFVAGADGTPSAAKQAGVRIGSVISAVNGFPTASKSDIVSVLSDSTKCPTRSVIFSFTDPQENRSSTQAPAPAAEAASTDISVTFTEPGSLGLKFSPNKQTGQVVILGINAGTQAEAHTQLKPGLVLVRVGDTSVVDMPYKQVIETIKAGGRPLACVFSAAVSTSTAEAGSAESPTAGTSSSPKAPAPAPAAKLPDPAPAAEAASTDISVTFTEPGSLGLKFSPNKQTGQVVILGINAGTQAEAHTQLKPGLVLVRVGDTSVVDMPYKQVIETIKAGGRPLACVFSAAVSTSTAEAGSAESPTAGTSSSPKAPAPAPAAKLPDPAPAAEAASTDISVTFTEPGSLGLKFSPNKQTGQVVILGINAGTQAEAHTQLKPGLVLVRVGDTSVVDMPYKQVIETIKAGGRPLACVFSAAVSTSTAEAGSAESPTAGTSSSPKAPAPAPAAKLPDPAPAAEAASTDISVTFTEPGSLGLKFSPNKQTGQVVILGINAGTQAEAHTQLKPGLVLVRVGDTSVVDMPYKQVIETIKAGGRPLACVFSAAVSTSTAEAGSAESPTAGTSSSPKAPAPAPAAKLPDPAPAAEAASTDISVTFTEPGSLGLKFSPNKQTGQVVILGINAGTQAEAHTQLKPGLVLVRVGDTSVVDMPYKQVIETIKAGGRPLACVFSAAVSTSTAEAGSAGYFEVTFQDVAPLGLTWSKVNGSSNSQAAVVSAVRVGSQAASAQPAITPGMLLVSIQGRETRGLDFKSQIAAIRVAGRPIRLGLQASSFPIDATTPVHSNGLPQASRLSNWICEGAPALVNDRLGRIAGKPNDQGSVRLIWDTGEESGWIAASNLKRFTANYSGVGDFVRWIKSDDDIPDGMVGQVVSLRPNGRRRVRWRSGREFNHKMSELRSIDNQLVDVTFTQPGPLGLSIKSKSAEHKAEIVEVKPGTQAAKFSELVVGMALQSVDGHPTDTYRQAMAALKAAGRPATLSFKFEDIDELAATIPRGFFESTFTKLEPLGIVWNCPHGPKTRCVIKEIKPGMQAGADLRLCPGLTLMSVNGKDTAGLDQKGQISMIRIAGRPIVLGLQNVAAPAPAAAPTPAAAPSPHAGSPVARIVTPKKFEGYKKVIARFRHPEALGIKFTSTEHGVEILSIADGSQAFNNEKLHPGLVLLAVGANSVVDKQFSEVMQILKASGRPVTLAFVTKPGSSLEIQPQESRGENPEQPPDIADTNASLELQQQEEVEVSATPTTGIRSLADRQEVLDLVRQEERDLLEPLKLTDTEPEPEQARSDGATNSGSNMPVNQQQKDALMEHNAPKQDLLNTVGRQALLVLDERSIDKVGYKETDNSETNSNRSTDISVTFTEPGSLGLKFSPNKQTGQVVILGINAGTQAEAHTQLKPGLVLVRVGDTSVVDMPYKQVIETIKAGGRPLACVFSAAVSTSTAEAGSAESPTAGTSSSPKAPAPAPAAKLPDPAPAAEAASTDISVTFTEPGSLGLKFSPNKQTGQVVILGINAGTQAEAHTQLKPGLVLVRVGDTSVVDMPYKQVIETIKAGGRPLACVFSAAVSTSTAEAGSAESPTAGTSSSPKAPAPAPAAKLPDPAPAAEAASTDISVTFTEPGSLGLKFSPNKQTGQVVILGINAGTQAEAHTQLKPGLVLVRVGDTSVVDMPYKQVIETIKAGGRPLACVFSAAVSTSTAEAGSAESPTAGTSSSPKAPAPAPAAKLPDPAPAAEAASTDISVTFTEPGSLGLKFSPNKQTGQVVILGINAGTQAEAHTQLKPGLVLVRVGDTSVVDMPYKQVIETIKAGGRPLACVFSLSK